MQTLAAIQEKLKQQQQADIQLRLTYRVIYSSLMGNIPINDSIQGEILGYPVDIRLGHRIIPNSSGSFPVNTGLEGWIGEDTIKGHMPYTVIFNTVAGNIPVNTAVSIKSNGKTHNLAIPISWVPGHARGGGGGGSAPKKPSSIKKTTVKYVKGTMMEVEGGGDESGPPQEAGRPIPVGLKGEVENIEVDLSFHYTYYINASSGRNPVNVALHGTLCYKP